MKQITQAEVRTYVAEVQKALDSDFPEVFVLNVNRWGWHARCQQCGEGFTETGGAKVSTLRRHALKHAVA